ncbi:O-antigen ligase family protein [Candidatus Daviesbacteria bacterium]|nr:O-antigen ligase family protein [Candidatus Daviesbacteria bacterium]
MAAYLVVFLLFFLPLVVIPIGISPFETPKVILTEAVINTLLFLKIINFKKPQLKQFINPQIIFVGILFILSLDTSLLFKSAGAFFGNAFRLQGQFLFMSLLLFSLMTKNIQLDQIPKFLYQLSLLFLFMGTVILGSFEGRAFGTLGEPNALAATALFIFPFTWSHCRRLIRFLTLVATCTLILLSGSRAGLIGLIIEVVFIILIRVKTSTLKATIICILLMMLSLTLPVAATPRLFENRAEIWQTALMAGLKSPFIGHGFGSIQKIIHKEAVSLNNNVQYQIVDSAHNFLLDFWIQGGLVGVVSISLLIYLAFQRFIQHKKLLETTALLGLMTAMLFNPLSVVNLLAFWWLIGYNNNSA